MRRARPPAIDRCWFQNAHGRCLANVERRDDARLVFCREHRRSISDLLQQQVIEASKLEALSLWRRVVWATARLQQLLESRQRDEARAVVDELLVTRDGFPLPPAAARDLVVVLQRLVLTLGPRHPLIEAWREGARRHRPAGGWPQAPIPGSVPPSEQKGP